MRFYYRKVNDGKGESRHQARLLNADNDDLLSLCVSANEIPAWKAVFFKMMGSERQRFDTLIQSASQLQECSDTTFTFYRMLIGLLKCVESCDDNTVNGRTQVITVIREILKSNTRLNFLADYDCKDKFCLYGIRANEAALRFRYKTDVKPSDIYYEIWGNSLFKSNKSNKWQFRHNYPTGRRGSRSKNQDAFTLPQSAIDVFQGALHNYDLLTEIVLQRANASEAAEKSFIVNSFANFSKAMIAFLDESIDFIMVPKPPELLVLKKKIPELCAFIVSNQYDDFENQKMYLERILKSDQKADDKAEQLGCVIRDVQESIVQETHETDSRTKHVRLKLIIGTVSEYYIGQYDLNRAVEFWSMLNEKDWILRRILSFYRAPLRYLSAISVFILATSLAVFSNRFITSPCQRSVLALSSIGLVSLVALAPAVFAVAFTIRKLAKIGSGLDYGLDYLDLLLPRFLGAIIVGLSVLLLQDISWRIGLQMQWLNVIIVCSLVYSLSFIYIFIDVHKTLRSLAAESTQKPKLISRSIGTSFQIFVIGLVGSFFAVLLTTLLLSGTALPQDSGSSSILGIAPQVYSFHSTLLKEYPGAGVVLQVNSICLLCFFPKVVFVWTGLALLALATAQKNQ